MQLFSGLALGAILVMLALGLSIVFGILGVVNFAHGALFMAGAYAGLFFLDLTGSFWAALVLAPIGVGALGLVIERFLLRPLNGRSPEQIRAVVEKAAPFAAGQRQGPGAALG